MLSTSVLTKDLGAALLDGVHSNCMPSLSTRVLTRGSLVCITRWCAFLLHAFPQLHQTVLVLLLLNSVVATDDMPLELKVLSIIA